MVGDVLHNFARLPVQRGGFRSCRVRFRATGSQYLPEPPACAHHELLRPTRNAPWPRRTGRSH